MKRALLTIFSIIFCLVSSIGNSNDLICEYTNFTCEEVEYSTLTKRDQIYYKKFSNIPFTGFVKGKCCEKK